MATSVPGEAVLSDLDVAGLGRIQPSEAAAERKHRTVIRGRLAPRTTGLHARAFSPRDRAAYARAVAVEQVFLSNGINEPSGWSRVLIETFIEHARQPGSESRSLEWSRSFPGPPPTAAR